MKPTDGYIRYIINPKAGATSAKLTGRQFEKYLINHGFEVRTALTTSLEHACELANNAAIDFNCAMVVVVGGDGTVRAAMQGLEG
ncbi:MAG TPA: diacylglycerol kinase family protein, partial [Sedimentisphaerales bacterium]|nr:diacylglycerol kinase family protein [Sedimentisphaerales bacterium]